MEQPVPGQQPPKKEDKKIRTRYYKKSLRTHKDTVLKVSALEGPFGGHVITGSADNSAISKCHHLITVTVWNVTGAKAVRVQKISTERPSDEELFKYEDHERERINYSSEHVLNTPSALRR